MFSVVSPTSALADEIALPGIFEIIPETASSIFCGHKAAEFKLVINLLQLSPIVAKPEAEMVFATSRWTSGAIHLANSSIQDWQTLAEISFVLHHARASFVTDSVTYRLFSTEYPRV
ncbi:hypothetical protein D9M69_488170 [compost metagenome]